MDYQEAIGYFERRLKLKEKEVPSENSDIKKADDTLKNIYKTAVSAMEELEQYQQLGTLEEVREAVERQNPKPPNWHINPVVENGKLPVCPTCNKIMVRTEILGRTIDEHCVTCGQAIDWSVIEC